MYIHHVLIPTYLKGLQPTYAWYVYLCGIHSIAPLPLYPLMVDTNGVVPLEGWTSPNRYPVPYQRDVYLSDTL